MITILSQMHSSKITFLILFTILALVSITYGLIIDETIRFFLGSSKYYLNDGVAFGRGFLIILAPTFLIFAPFVGYLADRFGDRRVIFSCTLFLIAACGILFPAIHQQNVLLIICAHFLFGIGMCIWPVLLSILLRLSADSHSRLLNIIIFILLSHLFFVAGLMAHRYQLFDNDHTQVFYLLLFILIITLTLIPMIKPSLAYKPNTFIQSFSYRTTRLFTSSKFKWGFLAAAYIIVAHAIFIESPNQHIKYLGDHFKHDYDFFMSVSYACMMLSSLSLFLLYQRIHNIKKLIITGAIMTLIGCLGQIISNSTVLFWSLSILASLGFGLMSIILLYASFSAGKKHAGILMGYYFSLWAIAMAFGNIFTSLASIYFNHVAVINSSRILVCLLMLFLVYTCYKANYRDHNGRSKAYSSGG